MLWIGLLTIFLTKEAAPYETASFIFQFINQYFSNDWMNHYLIIRTLLRNPNNIKHCLYQSEQYCTEIVRINIKYCQNTIRLINFTFYLVHIII